MVVQNERQEKTCCFYVSDFHLEMILIPYINKKIEENIVIITEKNLKETVEILISKMNLKKENKNKILSLGWNGEQEIKENSNIIIIGTKDYINNKDNEIKHKKPLSVLHCYNFEEENNNMENIIKEYKNTLNTLGKNNF